MVLYIYASPMRTPHRTILQTVTVLLLFSGSNYLLPESSNCFFLLGNKLGKVWMRRQVHKIIVSHKWLSIVSFWARIASEWWATGLRNHHHHHQEQNRAESFLYTVPLYISFSSLVWLLGFTVFCLSLLQNVSIRLVAASPPLM